jgi:hypothetical protein
VRHTDWDELEAPARHAIESRTGRVRTVRTVNAGLNSQLAVVLDTSTGWVFAKGLRADHPGVVRQMSADAHEMPGILVPADVTDIRKVTAASLIDEAVSWGIQRRTASAEVTETLDQVLAAIPVTPGDARVLAVIREQAERISRVG